MLAKDHYLLAETAPNRDTTSNQTIATTPTQTTTMQRNFSFPGRSAVHAVNGMIATSHPLASAVGLKVLTEGGSAVDAAIAATAVLSVAEPHMTGIGGDCFALVSTPTAPSTPSASTNAAPTPASATASTEGNASTNAAPQAEGNTSTPTPTNTPFNITAINGSGRAPAAASVDALKAAGLTSPGLTSPGLTSPGLTDAGLTSPGPTSTALTGEIPGSSPHAVTIPGAVGAWWALHQRFGRLDWDRVLWPAVAYAEGGIAVHGRVARDWANNTAHLAADPDAAAQYLKAGAPYKTGTTYQTGTTHNTDATHNPGTPYTEGDLFRHPRLAAALREIQTHGRDGFYKGAVMEDMLRKLRAMGGLHEESDFTEAAPEFVPPIATDAFGHTIWECPPNGQGIAALVLVRLLACFDLTTMDEIDRIHLHAEASKIAYALRDALVADPAFADVPVAALLADDHIAGLAGQIDMNRAAPTEASDFPPHPHTVYLAVVDGNGMAVSLINSIFDDFGSGISTPEFGVLFHSRGRAFRLEDSHPNRIEGGKRPMHTIIPGMISTGDAVIGPFGVMGGQYQAAGHGMIIARMLGLGMTPQQALDAPRSFAHGGVLQLEEGYDAKVAAALEGRGHVLDYPSGPIGGGQVILRNPETGVMSGGSDPRKDGLAIGY